MALELVNTTPLASGEEGKAATVHSTGTRLDKT